jgi:signal transduction histidine kinase
MQVEANRTARSSKVVYALVALVTLFLLAEAIAGQAEAPALEFTLDPHHPAIIGQVVPGSQTAEAGLQAGDAITRIENKPFDLSSLATLSQDYRVGQAIHVLVSRNGKSIEFTLRVVSATRLNPIRLIRISLAVSILWIISNILLWRFIQKPEVRILYLLAQSAGIGFLLPAIHLTDWNTLSSWQIVVSGLAVDLGILLSFHFVITFPMKLGSPALRRWLLGMLYTLGLAIAVLWFFASSRSGFLNGEFVAAAFLVGLFVAAGLLLLYSFLRHALPIQRRQLRLVALGFFLSVGPSTFLFSLPQVITSRSVIPEWLAGICLVAGLIIYVIVILRQNLTGADQLLNRTVVYFVLFTGILLLLVFPMIYLERTIPDDWIIHVCVLAGLTSLIAFSFGPIRLWLQQKVDSWFYGGWYDYPRVIESVSAALAHSLTWHQLDEILTRQVPKLMSLTGAWLTIGNEPAPADTNEILTPIHIPLQFEDQPYGMWSIGARRDGDDFSTYDRKIFAAMAPQIEVALSNILHVEKLHAQLDEIRASQKTLTNMGRQLIRGRDEEQERLSRELHDGPLQELVGINLQLGLLLSKMGPELEKSGFGDTLTGLRMEVRNLMSELREVCTGLRPPMLDTLGLSSALRGLIDSWSAEEHIPVHQELPLDACLSFLNSEVSLNLYRVVQQALSNIAHHASASQVAISLDCDPQQEGLTLTVQDDGIGFEPEKVYQQATPNHFGLASMHERVKLIGGQWSISSAPGRGTMIQITWQKKDWLASESNPSTAIIAGPG